MTNRFVMVGHPRTGSTLLRELLIQHPDVLMFSELFHPFLDERKGTHAIETTGEPAYYDDENEDAFDFLERLAWNPANASRAKAIGFKLFARYLQAPGTARLFARLKEEHPEIRVIHLVRDNLLDVWVSTKLAERSGVWKIGAHSERGRFDATEPFDANPWEMKEAFEFSVMMTDFFRRHFGPGRYLEINYDRLTSDTDDCLLEVFRFLGVGPMLVEVPLQKQNRRSHLETLLNYRELQAFFADGPFARHFPAIPSVPRAGPPPPLDPPAAATEPEAAAAPLPVEYDSLQSAAQSLGIHRWIAEVGLSLDSPVQRRLFNVKMPTAPTADFQRIFVGSSGTPAALEAGVFYRYVLDTLPRHGITRPTRLLDFGCGWGRITRLFLREVPAKDLFGVDTNVWGIESCRTHVPQACFLHTEAFPPLPFRDQFFDVVIAYSVFSHLSEFSAGAWIGEIARLLRPGGILIATTHAPSMLDRVRRLRDGEEPMTMPWHHNLVSAWTDTEASLASYRSGGYLYARTSPDEEHYGDTIVSPGYVRKVWGNLLEPLDYIDNAAVLPQAAFTMRKRS